MFGIDDALFGGLLSAGSGLLGALFGGGSSEPDYDSIFNTIQNSGMYRKGQNMMESSYYTPFINDYNKSLSRTFADISPTASGLLGLATAQGGNFGTSNVIAKKQADNIMAKNREAVSNASLQYGSELTRNGMGVGANLMNNAYSTFGPMVQGSLSRNSNRDDFYNNLMGLGGGILANYWTKG